MPTMDIRIGLNTMAFWWFPQDPLYKNTTMHKNL